MIFWTVMPLELVFNQEPVDNPYEEISYAGVSLLVERSSPNECRIVRILSTDPAHFLRPDLQPGSILTYKPVCS